ncbi:MAG: RIP metalloprotease RseP [Rhizobiales bacterium]|nr:RIP metalloprotease RseP [Hyphomicrobiales bacterium]
MELLGQGFTWIVAWCLPFLFVLTIVVFFHELGHFLVARWNGIGVAKFAIGFGPDLWSFTDKKGTVWALSAIPLGGYVKFIDDANAASTPGDLRALEAKGHDTSQFFARKKLWQRAAVVAAGPIANFILAIVIFTGLFMTTGRDIISAKVDEIVPGSVAASAGFRAGDLIIAVNGSAIESFSDLQRIVSVSAEIPLTVSVLREGAEITLIATPEFREVNDPFGGKQRIGQLGIQRSSSADAIIHKSYGPLEAVGEAVDETVYVIRRTATFFVGLFTGRESIDQLGGPIRIAEVSGQVAAISFAALVSLTAVLSVSIGIMNLLPIPVLDGGHLLFYAIEAVRGRPVPEKAQEWSFKVGLAVLLSFMLLVTTIDISRHL